MLFPFYFYNIYLGVIYVNVVGLLVCWFVDQVASLSLDK